MKKTITITEAKPKTSSNNKPYLSIKTTEGRLTCWEIILFDILLASIGQPLEVEVMQKGDYENIIGAGDMIPTQTASAAYYPAKKTGIEQAQVRKAEFIKEAQARKNDAILLF